MRSLCEWFTPVYNNRDKIKCLSELKKVGPKCHLPILENVGQVY